MPRFEHRTTTVLLKCPELKSTYDVTRDHPRPLPRKPRTLQIPSYQRNNMNSRREGQEQPGGGWSQFRLWEAENAAQSPHPRARSSHDCCGKTIDINLEPAWLARGLRHLPFHLRRMLRALHLKIPNPYRLC